MKTMISVAQLIHRSATVPLDSHACVVYTISSSPPTPHTILHAIASLSLLLPHDRT
eukprot:SAG31_NODE_944_length_10844_cov_11.214053_12_plen_56_part_00